MELWNEINLPLPTYTCYKTSRDKIDIDTFLQVLQGIVDYIKNQENFHTEAAQLTRLIFMNCKQLRMMKGLHEMKKCHQALLRYLNMDLASTVETFKGFLSNDDSETCTVPFRHNLDFILIRLQGLSKLLIRVVHCAKKSASFFLGLIKAGSFYAKGVVFLSTLASVWNQSREFCKFVVEQYNKLKSFRGCLKEKQNYKWIDGNYELPDRLDTWIGDDWNTLITNPTFDGKLLLKENEIENFVKNKNKMLDALRNLKDVKVELVESSVPDDAKIKDEPNDSLELEDVTPIPRVAKESKPSLAPNEHLLSSLTSKYSVKRFIKDETFYRKVNPQKSLTINKMKRKIWNEFAKDIKTKVILMQDISFVNYVKDYLQEYNVE